MSYFQYIKVVAYTPQHLLVKGEVKEVFMYGGKIHLAFSHLRLEAKEQTDWMKKFGIPLTRWDGAFYVDTKPILIMNHAPSRRELIKLIISPFQEECEWQ